MGRNDLTALFRKGARRTIALVRKPTQLADNSIEPDFWELHRIAAPYSMTTHERMYGLWLALRYLYHAQIEGDVVECGVWRGGSSLLAALTLSRMGDTSRTLYLYDTFEGMTPPTEEDVSLINGQPATALLDQTERQAGAFNVWSYATVDDVKQTMAIADYPRVKYVVGRVEVTIPAESPDRIALLRLDTDWYQSTLHELEQLWPRIVPGGVLIIDDYGDWEGARQAVDEYFADRPVLLTRLDRTGRMTVKR